MTKKADVYVCPQTIKLQKEFINKIRQISAQKSAKTGSAPLAFTRTYGCAQNENDTEKIRGILKEAGFEQTDNFKKADIIIYNTCAVRENAELKVFGKIGALKHLKNKNPDLIIGICGCMMQQEHIVSTIEKKYKHVDLIFGTHSLHSLPESLYTVMMDRKRVTNIVDIDGVVAEDMPTLRENPLKSGVSIMYGCNNFCTYCIVPYVRGRERSRRPEDIVKEIQDLVASGCKEVMLLGQNVNSYGYDSDFSLDFPDLLKFVCTIDGIERVRFLTSHPKDISDKLIDVLSSESKLCNSLHLPFQAGSNAVLERMNRKYTREEYLEKIEKIRTKIPNIALSTDIIVGFPNETDEDFEDTIDMLERVNFDIIYSFIYSKRVGTPAEKMDDATPEQIKHQRFDRMLQVQNAISREINQNYVGNIYEILVEGESKNDPDMYSGRTTTNKVVSFKACPEEIGNLINVKIISANTWSLLGEKL